jgi:hypothetical protein
MVVDWLWRHYHKNWVDVLTWAGAGVFTLYKGCRTGNWKLPAIGRAYMDGAAVFPLCLLALAAVWRTGVEGLLEASRPTLSLAGVFALTAVLQIDSKGSGQD